MAAARTGADLNCRRTEWTRRVVARPLLGGLHHVYERAALKMTLTFAALHHNQAAVLRTVLLERFGV